MLWRARAGCFFGYIRISQRAMSERPLSALAPGGSHRTWKLGEICPGRSTSPTVRKMMSWKASRVRNPLTRFLTIRMMRLSPSATALVSRTSTKVIDGVKFVDGVEEVAA